MAIIRDVPKPDRVFLFSACFLLLSSSVCSAGEVPFNKRIVDMSFDGARTIYSSDIDGDGDLDALVAASGAGAIHWYENTAGDGSAWSEHIVDDSFGGAHEAIVADLDGDGDGDVLGAANGDDDITWWENSGDGSSWTEHPIDSNFNGARSVDAADLDGDGDLDVLGASSPSSSEIFWWENTSGDGSLWSAHVVDTGQHRGWWNLVAEDIDGDGDLDILAAAQIADDIIWWENSMGDGSTWIERTVTADFNGVRSVSAADFDGDGDLDVLGAASNANDVTWWENTAGDGSAWTAREVDHDFDGAYAAFAIDMDEDGDLDVLGAGATADEVTWWENSLGDGTSWTEYTIESAFDGTRTVMAADLDADGDVDVLSTAQLADEVAWWENETIHRSALFPHEQSIELNFNQVTSVIATDVDGDGDLDTLGLSQTGAVTWWENTDGVGSSWLEHAIGTGLSGGRKVFAVDIDSDGDLDVLGVGAGDGEITWWQNLSGDGSLWGEHNIVTGFTTSITVQAGDIDGDGHVDVAGGSFDDSEIAWWQNSAGDGSGWVKTVVDAAFASVRSVLASDMDGDGDLDIVGSGLQVAWWENTAGDGSAWTMRSVDPIARPFVIKGADLDLDGDLDLFGASWSSDGIEWWENSSGDGTVWIRHDVDDSPSQAYEVDSADLDGDRDLDILATDFTGDDLLWWENTAGDGSAWLEHVVDADFNGAVSVDPGDMDGDGDLDILAAAFLARDISWWPNHGGQFALPTLDIAPTRANESEAVAVLDIDLQHRGRAGDGAAELATLELRLESFDGSPMSPGDAEALLSALDVVLDDGSGVYEPANDTTSLSTVTLFDLTGGVLTVPFFDDDPNVQVAFGETKKIFVLLDIAADASTQPDDEIRVTHLTESSSTGEDAANDLPLTLEFSSATSSALIEINDPPLGQPDAFETLQGWQFAGNVFDDNGSGADSDEELDSFTAGLESGPSQGTLIGGLAAAGSFVYRPEPGFNGDDSFTYRLSDGESVSDAVTVTISVQPALFADDFESGDTGAWTLSSP